MVVVVVVVLLLASSAYVGYRFGRRAGTPVPTWKQRTSRVAMGKLALSLAALVIARRIHRHLVTQPARMPVLRGNLTWARSR